MKMIFIIYHELNTQIHFKYRLQRLWKDIKHRYENVAMETQRVHNKKQKKSLSNQKNDSS